jgi:hypothetical protein
VRAAYALLPGRICVAATCHDATHMMKQEYPIEAYQNAHNETPDCITRARELSLTD